MTEPAGQPVEILIPYVGDRALLEVAVHSVQRQWDPSWRLLVVEDGPQGTGCGEWLAALNDDRITHLVNPRNLGLARNFQHCLESSRCERIVFMGCDDALLPNYVDLVRAAARLFPVAAAISPAVEVIDNWGHRARPLTDRVKSALAPKPQSATVYSGQPLLSSLMLGNWAYFPAICWSREQVLALGFRADLPVTLDLALLAEVILAEGELVLLPETAFQYRRHHMSVSSRAADNASRFAEEERLYAELTAACRARGWEDAARASRIHATSRLHAASLLLPTLQSRDVIATRRLAKHVVGF